jgi:uncharacterized protein YjbI with pentapeptide repeats
MANEEHLKILKQGVEVWNRWRIENRDIRLDLSEADLSGADLRQADLRAVDLRAVDLSGADLREADLCAVTLWMDDVGLVQKARGADLREANLYGADLHGTQIDNTTQIDGKWRLVWEIVNQVAVGRDLRGADLSGANLSGAYLRKADLSKADLSEADLSKAYLRKANLSETDLSGAKLGEAILRRANLSKADLVEAYLRRANLSRADFIRADLSRANLRGANLSWTNFRGAILSGADLGGARLVRANLSEARLIGCSVFGISAWMLNLEGATQSNLIISPSENSEEPVITVDNLEVAQFTNLLLHNEKIGPIIDTITSKVVLILGRFTPERKEILDAIRDELRHRDYLPVMFDFEKPSSRDLTETVSTLAHLARFIIADITEAKSIPQELQAIVPDLPSVPVQPLIASSDYEYGLFERFRRFPWVLDTYRYESQDELLDALKEKVIEDAEMKAEELSTQPVKESS